MSEQGNTVEVYGWELHYTGDRSDKFYRVLVAGCAAIFHWGARDSAGQGKAFFFTTPEAAIAKAREMSNAKEAKGYGLSKDFVGFPFEVARLDGDVCDGIAGRSGGRSVTVQTSPLSNAFHTAQRTVTR